MDPQGAIQGSGWSGTSNPPLPTGPPCRLTGQTIPCTFAFEKSIWPSLPGGPDGTCHAHLEPLGKKGQRGVAVVSWFSGSPHRRPAAPAGETRGGRRGARDRPPRPDDVRRRVPRRRSGRGPVFGRLRDHPRHCQAAVGFIVFPPSGPRSFLPPFAQPPPASSSVGSCQGSLSDRRCPMIFPMSLGGEVKRGLIPQSKINLNLHEEIPHGSPCFRATKSTTV